jgi:PTS system nitrogen regulatory IIA component
MEIREFLDREHILPQLFCTDKALALRELSRRASAALGLPQETILNAITAREKLGSTGLGQGFALPHARIEGLDHFFGLFARIGRAIPFEAADEKPVDLIFFLLIPANSVVNYVTVLAAIARRIRDQDIAKRLRLAEDPAVLHALLTSGPEEGS